MESQLYPMIFRTGFQLSRKSVLILEKLLTLPETIVERSGTMHRSK